MADTPEQARVRAGLRDRADKVSTRVPAPGEKPAAKPAVPAPRKSPETKPKGMTEARQAQVGRQVTGQYQRAAARQTRQREQATAREARQRQQSRQRTLNAASRIRPPGGPEFRNYQGIILAEFVAAELLVAITPIAARKNEQGLSPYVPRDMTKLLALGLVFFLLELAAVTGRGAGRFGAWFGLLILLAVGLNEANNVVDDLDLFAGIKNKITGAIPGGTGDTAT